MRPTKNPFGQSADFFSMEMRFPIPKPIGRERLTPEIILVPRLVVVVEGYFTYNPTPIATNCIYYDFKKFAHCASDKLTPFFKIVPPRAISQTTFT